MAEAAGLHKGRTTRTPWDPVLVQKTITTSPASQARSAIHCIRKVPSAIFASGASRPMLKVEFESQLNQAWRSGADHVTKRCAEIGDIAVHRQWSVKLAVVENVESFDPKLQ